MDIKMSFPSGQSYRWILYLVFFVLLMSSPSDVWSKETTSLTATFDETVMGIESVDYLVVGIPTVILLAFLLLLMRISIRHFRKRSGNQLVK